jgi:hypothetical protein
MHGVANECPESLFIDLVALVERLVLQDKRRPLHG